MQQYVSTKIVNGMPMTRQEYIDLRGWTLPENENGADEGYLVEYRDGGQPNTNSHKGYISWSPKDVFERASLPLGNIEGLAPHHQRMLAERAQLCDRITKLNSFIGTNQFLDLEPIEQTRLQSQLDGMTYYRRELDERLYALKNPPAC
ncbi:crAss001_48 related protein [Leclercia adecarboxylata]|uniref:crAss001_48 related protein n=1 Tax=Leclercia adecarboxylata TaxID=83655 RepID=UPI0013C60D8F|nr:hypothetical protein [Leclercia adecarboxylata]NEG94116.1 hypothetical protein [Leclercia adecarboxylata]